MRPGVVLPIALLWLPAIALALDEAHRLAPGRILRAAIAPVATDTGQMILHYSALPRLMTALLAGAALALSGCLLQRVLRNPLAEPATLGIFGGAQLLLTAAVLWWPAAALAAGGRIAFAGAAAGFALVILLARREGLGPLALILAGLVAGVWFGGLNAMLALFNHEVMQGLFLWQGGSLVQSDWTSAGWLAVALALASGAAVVIRRPLDVLDLGDSAARGLGLGLTLWRGLALTIAVGLAAMVAARVGVIGFVGLVAPAIAAAGGRTGGWVSSALLGAGMLALADQAVQALGLGIPTGAAMALIGGVALLILLPRLRPTRIDMEPARRLAVPGSTSLSVLAAALAVALVPALSLGRSPDGWVWDAAGFLDLRWPRVTAAMAAGASYAWAGVLLQRLTANPMAGPELLGISSGASLGLILAVTATGAMDRTVLVLSTSAGALAAGSAVTALAARRRFSPQHLILIGLAATTLLSALASAMLAGGDPRAAQLLGWLAGSTYRVEATDAALAIGATLAILAVAPLLGRWLDILPLGPDFARSLGMNLRGARLAILCLAAAATSIGTLIIGPLGFLGLMAPHIACRAGLRGATRQGFGAALIGATLMVLADWLGRNAAFPWQIPAGLTGSLLAGAWLLAAMSRR